MSQPVAAPNTPSPLQLWLRAYRVEITLFLGAFLILAAFSSKRFWRQSEAPHFVYQSKAFLEGRSDIAFDVLPNFEDWACVREVNGVKARCEGRPLETDRWYSSFPWFPSVVMLPFVAIHGYQFNDTSFGVMVAALAIALFYMLLRTLKDVEGTGGDENENRLTALVLGFCTLFFYASLRGEVWFSAEVMGVAFTALYLRNALRARQPLLAGIFWSMAVLTRSPLIFTGVFFVLEVLAPNAGNRVQQIQAFFKKPNWKPLGLFVAGAAPLGLIAAIFNFVRFGSFTEFGHRYFFNNRVNADIDRYGLFHPHYLLRNLDAAFMKLPTFSSNPLKLGYDAWGMSLFITLPLIALCFVPAANQKRALQLVGAMVGLLVASFVFPPLQMPVGDRVIAAWLVLALVLGFFAFSGWEWVKSKDAPRLLVPVLVTLLACMLPGLMYQNTGYAQFGFRFSIDYTPYLVLLIPLGGWSWKKPLPMALGLLALLVNFWGAVGFYGFTEQVRRW
ncbi:MAG: hypothetical protein ACO1OB_04340 [Archangium sp.]